jgi:hypothetical protein
VEEEEPDGICQGVGEQVDAVDLPYLLYNQVVRCTTKWNGVALRAGRIARTIETASYQLVEIKALYFSKIDRINDSLLKFSQS